MAVIDASEDPAQAVDVFLQAVGMLGIGAVAVYVEKTHEDLELFVRMMGALLLLGPMSMEEWESFLDHRFPALIPLDASSAGIRQKKREILPNVGEAAGNKVVFYRPLAG